MYLYHLKPQRIIGNYLLPLNQMPRDSDIYREHAKKYNGRESLMKEHIPKMDCLWNDVIQFSSIHPRILADKLLSLQPSMILKRTKILKISIDDICNTHNPYLFTRKRDKSRVNFKILDNEIEKLTPSSYSELQEIPVDTLRTWERAIEKNDKLLWFPFVPHIFIRDKINISRFEVETLNR